MILHCCAQQVLSSCEDVDDELTELFRRNEQVRIANVALHLTESHRVLKTILIVLLID
jgi:hypothetical protein